ncbi:baseplate J/gp47 family protein [Paenibacillus lentus]|uniref:Baseplate J/gp47 family protein n=1 Tax=Paenibacillus lentus TaxID=1338368 RepID=A0A3Q8SED4_9BACL|nr:baseplate J/gp47 family protein [Paenibacillus lentus]AZK48785.1 baseplate J/gp47 family protein [Paenibacillus lentus]
MTEVFNLDTSYEDLLAQKLMQVDESLDRREGSIIFNATAANTLETIQMLVTLKHMTDLVFADTAPREYLIRRAAERGLFPLGSTKAKLKGVFNIDVPIGSRFSLDELNYEVIEQIATGEFVLECETSGEVGNQYLGTLIPVDYIDGLTAAELTSVLIPGEDEEDTEVFRKRYFNSFNSISFGGNRADYKSKVGGLNGVGGVRVYRAWNGGGTVKLVIINSLFEKPTQKLINEVQEAVDPLDKQGEGLGIAPIDHVVTVVGVNQFPIEITLNLTYRDGWNWGDVESSVQIAIDDYFKELATEWATAQTYEEDHTGLIVRVSQIETRLLSVEGILDISDTLLNGTSSNIELDMESIPVRGGISA